MPLPSTSKIVKKEPLVKTFKTQPGFLLNTKKPIATTSLDIKSVISNDSDSMDVNDKKTAPRTYSAANDRKSTSPEPNNSTLLYSTLKLPSPEPMEGKSKLHNIHCIVCFNTNHKNCLTF